MMTWKTSCENIIDGNNSLCIARGSLLTFTLHCEFYGSCQDMPEGWGVYSNCDWLPSSETVNIMLQYKYRLMFSFALCSYTDITLQQDWPKTSHTLPKLSLDCSHFLSPFNHPCVMPPHPPTHHSFTPFSPSPHCAHGHGTTEISHAPPQLPPSESGVGVWCLSEPVKTALILITPAALLPCFVALLRQYLHNHLYMGVFI